MYLTLNGTVIPNNGYVRLSDISSTDETALLCITNLPPPTNSSGDWFTPDGIRVFGTNVPGITRNRGPMVVRLIKVAGTPTEGIYKCSIEDNESVINYRYVGLYNIGAGIYSLSFVYT